MKKIMILGLFGTCVTAQSQVLDLPLPNLSFSRFYFANRSLECRLLVVDALNRNTGVTRTADANYFQTEKRAYWGVMV